MESKVSHLFIKTQRGQPVVPQSELELIERFGIKGDDSANFYSPRQVLISSLETLDKHNIKPGDIKENIVVQNMDVDRLVSGQVLQIGESVQIRITFGCTPCHYLETIRKGLTKELHQDKERGILGVVTQGGIVKVEDKVTVLSKKYEPIPIDVKTRFAWLVERIPSEKVVSYSQIIKILGLASVYYRALPTYIKKLDSEKFPIHKIVDSKGGLLRIIPNQKLKLESEGIFVNENKVYLDKYSWDSKDLYYNKISS